MTVVKGAPKIRGITFRRFKDGSDYSLMSAVSRESWLADGFAWVQTEDDIASAYRGDDDRDPLKDILLIEAEGAVIGYGEITTERVDDDSAVYWNSVHLLPKWRVRGIREAVFDFNEKELVRRANRRGGSGFLHAWANDSPNEWKSILLAKGFEPSWHVIEMVRSNLESVPRFDLPDGLEIRPISKSECRQVWDGMKEAYRVEPWYTESKFTDAQFREWIESPTFSSKLWQVAWEDDKVVGIVQTYVKEEENKSFNRKRGHTERIFVVPRWQRKGVAKALISRSLKLLREIGMQEATLDVNAENVSGALRLYESLGYKPTHVFTFFRKPVPARLL